MTDRRPFAHLHCHTHYSLLDGANKIPEYVGKVKEHGMNAAAITDHGNLYGAIEFYNACRSEEINPILGYEAYIAPGDHRDKSAKKMKDAQSHLTLLAMNSTGFYNLVKMSSTAYLKGYHYKPRIDKEMLKEHSEGIICLSGCASGDISKAILADDMKKAEELAAWFVDVFGDRFYMEIQNGGLEIQEICLEGTVDLANSMGLPLVATNDAHYLNREDAAAHDVLLCVNTKSFRSDVKRMKMDADEFYVRTPEEMYEAFPGMDEAVARSQEIADRVDINLPLDAKHYPVFRPPQGKTDTEYLREVCIEGLKKRFGEGLTDEHWERLDFELKVIERMGYSSYFLIVWDFVEFANEHKIPCQARGSACGALVAFALGLSNVCPLKYDLLFERFLDPSRAEPPDIDIDFCRDRRQMVIDYTKEKYGEMNVAQIGTWGTLKAKAAIRDVSRALSIPIARTNEIAAMVPDQLNISLEEALNESPELKEACDTDPQIKEMMDLAMALEGLARSAGTHAAGVVVADEPLDTLIPLQRITGKEDIVTQWDGPTVEAIGLLKMDFLGLRNLTILDKAVENVRKHRGVDIDPVKLPLDDKETFALLQRGETKGIFQLESGGMRDLLTKMKPDSFLDIIATSALYRPGPLEGGMVMDYVNVKNGRQEPAKVHPIVDEVLEETYGVMVYQEQVMRILNRVGGIELPSAYRCIKAISKKKLKIIAAFREEYLEGAKERGLDAKLAIDLFELIEKFAGYGFNKSHSTAYGAVAYQTAYLKAHYPVEFMAALLSCEMESHERIYEHIDDARRMKIEVLPPDVNRSDLEFTVDGEKIIFGMGAIKGLGENAIEAIVADRNENGPFRSLFDMTERIDPKILTKGNLEILIKAGGLDSLPTNAHRAQHMLMVERAVQAAQNSHRDRARGQMNLFGAEEEPEPDKGDETEVATNLPDTPEWTHSQKLNFEKDVIGFYLTSHPLTEFADRLERFATYHNSSLGELEDKTEIMLGGMISSVKASTMKKPSRNGHTKFANFDLEDATGIVRCIMWAEEYARYQEFVKSESMVFIKGRVDTSRREPNVIVNKLLTIEQAEKEFTQQVAIKFQNGLHSEEDMVRVRDVLNRYPGNTDVVLVVITSEEDKPRTDIKYLLKASKDLKVTCNAELRAELGVVLGEDSIQFIAPKRNGRNGNGYANGNGHH